MKYLFTAYSVVWLAFFGYNWYLVKRTDKLEKEVELLQRYLARGGEGDGGKRKR